MTSPIEIDRQLIASAHNSQPTTHHRQNLRNHCNAAALEVGADRVAHRPAELGGIKPERANPHASSGRQSRIKFEHRRCQTGVSLEFVLIQLCRRRRADVAEHASAQAAGWLSAAQRRPNHAA